MHINETLWLNENEAAFTYLVMVALMALLVMIGRECGWFDALWTWTSEIYQGRYPASVADIGRALMTAFRSLC